MVIRGLDIIGEAVEKLPDDVKKNIRYLPGISMDAHDPDMSGICPKIQGPGDPAMDFIIREEGDRGLPGFTNLIGVESPELTACLAIGEYVRGKFS